jgi:hypothetical protein
VNRRREEREEEREGETDRQPEEEEVERVGMRGGAHVRRGTRATCGVPGGSDECSEGKAGDTRESASAIAEFTYQQQHRQTASQPASPEGGRRRRPRRVGGGVRTGKHGEGAGRAGCVGRGVT